MFLGYELVNPQEEVAATALSSPDILQFSVIVPVYKQWHLVPNLLARLHEQSLPEEHFEILLVDNASPEFDSPERLPANARILSCEAPGSYAARNLGAKHALGQWLAFTDADCLPTENWLESLYAVACERHNSLVAGPVTIETWSARPNAWEIYDVVKGIPQDRYIARGYAATANLVVPKAVFDEFGGFDSKRFSGGDAEFCRRVGGGGHALFYCKAAQVIHPARSTWEEIATKARRIKGGQMAASTPNRRARLLNTFLPPIRGAWRFMTSRAHPISHRLIATGVLMRVWFVELAELFRLHQGHPPERR